ncbi:MAG: helix-turn-helix transcriptional regulator [Anaeromusa sp.]|uniref:helix-turn-helix transcriptional regulator n=1 Tax=Anaeromusa sp. TaxID=1872520 RepID=UPI002B219BF8|nr:helix-turn-helix transcriptional regulator [Anaeromusa sp.]MEA4836609.1 helix-turn-helix transcriptional regulator [Anaeromusa sp.]
MSELLKAARLKAGLTQLQVALKAGITERCYWNYEAGKRTPNIYSGQRIAKALGVAAEDLFPTKSYHG